jgi:hypothetical protein
LKPFIQRQIRSYNPVNLTNNESIQLLSKLPKDAKKSAVKIAIDESTHSSNIDPLLQEYKIIANISDPRNESHLNMIQLYAVCTSQLITHGTFNYFPCKCSASNFFQNLKELLMFSLNIVTIMI